MLTEDENEDKIEDLFYVGDMELYKTFMRKVCHQLKVWLRQDGPPSKIKADNSGISNVLSIKNSLMINQFPKIMWIVAILITLLNNHLINH